MHLPEVNNKSLNGTLGRFIVQNMTIENSCTLQELPIKDLA